MYIDKFYLVDAIVGNLDAFKHVDEKLEQSVLASFLF